MASTLELQPLLARILDQLKTVVDYTGAAIFIARCGVVLAGNDAAHTAQPQLPLASAHERALATQWLARQPG